MPGVYQHASDWIPGYPPFSGVIRVADGKFIACAADSQDWQDYLTWAAADVANVPDPFLSPQAGGTAIVLAPDEVPYGSMLESIPPEDPALGPPVMVDIPAMGALAGGSGMVGDTLKCTMGNWTNEPTMYEWRWFSDAPDDLSAGDTYVVRDSDAGHNIYCVVTATNLYGSTTAPPSNAVLAVAVPVDPPGTELASRSARPTPETEHRPEAEVEAEETEHRRSTRHDNHRGRR